MCFPEPAAQRTGRYPAVPGCPLLEHPAAVPERCQPCRTEVSALCWNTVLYQSGVSPPEHPALPVRCQPSAEHPTVPARCQSSSQNHSPLTQAQCWPLPAELLTHCPCASSPGSHGILDSLAQLCCQLYLGFGAGNAAVRLAEPSSPRLVC